ncbi:MAG: MFS transporter [Anaerolineales bacterium]|nr:MFS transporter [Anaerolineales bacterium]
MTRDNKLMAFALLLWGLGEGLFLYFQPLYLRELGGDSAMVGAALSFSALAMAATHIPAGYLSDRIGRKVLIVAGFGLGTLAALVMFLARDFWLFTLALSAYWFTGFMLAPLGAYVTEARGTQSVQRALSLVYAGFWAGTIVSPALGGWIGSTFGLRYAFLGSFATFTISTLVVALASDQPVITAETGVGRYRELIRNRPLLGYLALAFVAMLAMQIGLPFMPNFINEVRNYDVSVVGVLGSINSIGIVLANTLLGSRSPRVGLLLAQAFILCSMLVLLLVASWPGLVLAYALRAGWSLAHTMFSAQSARLVSRGERGLAYGLAETVSGAAMILGPLFAGWLYGWNTAAPFVVSAGLLPIMMALTWRFAPRTDAHTEEARVGPRPREAEV